MRISRLNITFPQLINNTISINNIILPHQYFIYLLKQHLAVNISSKNIKLLIFVTKYCLLSKNIKY